MTKLMCGSTDCAHNERFRCKQEIATIRPVMVHTLYNEWHGVWKCDGYRMSDHHREKLNTLGGNVRGARQKEEML